MKRKRYKCLNCGQVTIYHREGLPCAYCGEFSMALLNEMGKLFNSVLPNETNIKGGRKWKK